LHDRAAASMGQCKQASRRCAPVDELVHAVLQPGAHAGAGLERAGAVQTGPAMPGLRCGMDASLCLPNRASPTTASGLFRSYTLVTTPRPGAATTRAGLPAAAYRFRGVRTGGQLSGR
ncbi:MAG: hypothetical protein ACPIOQ_66305, partial [Promethearchaeia archaeon]